MSTHNPFDMDCGYNNDAIVDKLIGNAYQVVKYVAMNMPALRLISDNMLSLVPLNANLAALLDIQANLPALLELNAQFPAVVDVAENLTSVINVHDNMADVVNASQHMAAIIAAPSAAQLAQDWATKLGSEVATGLGYSARYYANLAASTLSDRPTRTELLLGTGSSLVGHTKIDATLSTVASVLTSLEQRVPLSVAAAPTAGAQVLGARARNSAVSITHPVTEWLCITAGTPGTWRAVSWVVFSGATGARPVPLATDVGLVFLDTTLAAAGKPITWNGTAWVDATGTTV